METEKYNGFRHIVCLNKQTGITHFVKSVRESDFKASSKELEINSSLDYYYSKNTFKTAKNRRTEDLLGLNTIVIDIDTHDTPRNELKGVISVLTHSLTNDNHNLPMTKIINTGRGIQIHIEIIQTSYVLSWLYKKVAEQIIEEYKKAIKDIKSTYSLKCNIDVDSTATTNVVGLIRLVNTYNTVSKTKVIEIFNNNRLYDLNDLIKDEAPTKKIQPIMAGGFEVNLINSRIRHIYNNHETVIGNRKKTIFLLYNNLIQVKENEEAKADVIRFNKSLRTPLKQNEVYEVFNYISKKGFLRFKQSTFIDWLGGEQITTREDQRKEKRHAKFLRDEKIKSLLSNEILTYREIAKTVGVTEKTIKRQARKFGLMRNRKD